MSGLVVQLKNCLVHMRSKIAVIESEFTQRPAT